MDELTGYLKHVLKWRKRAQKAETECDTLRKRNRALERILYEQTGLRY